MNLIYLLVVSTGIEKNFFRYVFYKFSYLLVVFGIGSLFSYFTS